MMTAGLSRSKALSEYLESMPGAYLQAFTLHDAEEHAFIVARRGSQIAHAEMWRTFAGSAVICVVADDQPGLLSVVTATLVAHGLDVVSAQIYCRRRDDGTAEAVDFFWVRSADFRERPREVDAEELVSVARTLRELIGEQQEQGRHPSERDTIPVPGPKPTRVYFEIDSLRRGEFVLIVETSDFPGLLFAISSALHSQSVHIAHSEIATEDGIAKDRFVLLADGREPLTAERLYDIQQAVHTAVRTDKLRSDFSMPVK